MKKFKQKKYLPLTKKLLHSFRQKKLIKVRRRSKVREKNL